ncbi:type II secretion system F family protein [Acetobacterium woodii]|uniref:Flp pilus assembly protein TadB n=1 Tax=Acetobacterium woodii (strain ATCC 29683 / DSM 1030 / JCM 2381 / KCTC 1655 / WB1) TaxID=931626 RepID=H6LDE8_ACEWD|nr:hypothetical protein [Acetobacterium woodii]AFA47920.1 hypothetical protein Awo_c11360 [Acetobacterium woodii DSM 1030]
MSGQSLLIFMMLVVGGFLMLDLSPRSITEIVMEWMAYDKKDIRSVIKRATHDQKKRRNPFFLIKRTMLEARSVLKISGREALFTTLILISLALFGGGFIFGLLVNNIPLSLTLSIGFGLLPFWYVKATEIEFLNELNDEMESALSGISTAYKRTGNFKKAVEDNLYNFNPPISQIFEEFLFETKYVSPDIERALEHMSDKLDNTIFKEWCEMVIACQNNPKLIPLLSGIVDKLADVKQSTSNLGVQLSSPLHANLLLGIIAIGMYPLFYFVNRTWFNALVATDIGKVITALTWATIFFVLNKSMKQKKPIEYDV